MPENKRIINYTTDTALSTGDYVVVDNSSEGTKKYDLGAGLAAVNASIASNTNAVAELSDDMEALESDGVVPSADQLISDNYTVDQTPYLYRQTQSNGADRAIEEIVGGSVAWNQLFGSMNTSATDGITTSYDSATHVISITNDSRTSNYSSGSTRAPLFFTITGHKYLINMAPVVEGVAFAYINNIALNNVFEATSTNAVYLRVTKDYDFVTAHPINSVTTFHLGIHDLTAMFGSTIADYIYSLEQSAAGAGVAFFRKLFPEEYYAYDAGTMMHVSGVSAKITRDTDENVIGNYSLDSSLTLRGIPKLDSNNQLYFDGDTYEADGTVTRKYGIVDLGTLGWNYNDGGYFYSSIGDKAVGNHNLICSKYSTTTGATVGEMSDKQIKGHGTAKYIYAKDSAYTDAASFKSAMSGVYMVYELATPTTETAEPYTNPQICDPYGTEEFVSTSLVPVGHYTKYPENLRAAIERVMKQVPEAPTANGTYTLKATRTSSGITYAWTAS